MATPKPFVPNPNYKPYLPDPFKPLVPGPPSIDRNREQDRRNMREYARQRYLEARKDDPDYD
jgi:hypothetical protein